jgi:hypothetical protein
MTRVEFSDNAKQTLSQTGSKTGGGEACVRQKRDNEKIAGKKGRA